MKINKKRDNKNGRDFRVKNHLKGSETGCGTAEIQVKCITLKTK